MWCSRAEHPFPADVVSGWAVQPDVTAYLLLADGEPVGYGEVWSDAEEDEAELARLIIAPQARGQGAGRALTAALVARADNENIFLRVHPDNAIALATYRGAGFEDVAPQLQSDWNAVQPRPYTWLRYTSQAR